MHRDRVPDHVGDDRGAAGPGLDHPLLVAGVEVVDPAEEMIVHERALLQAPGHAALLPQRRAPRLRRRRTINLSDSLWRALVRPSFFPHGETGWRPPLAL